MKPISRRDDVFVAAPGEHIERAATRSQDAPRGAARGHMGSMGRNEKAINFGPSLRRLIRMLRPERGAVAVVVLLTAVSQVANVIIPVVLGQATNVIFAGVMSRTQPAGESKAEVVARLRTEGNTTLADMIQAMDFVPGQGVDFELLASWLGILTALALVMGIFMWAQGWVLSSVVQRTVYRLRAVVSDKLDRLPLSYFDRQPRGELLSRITNDIDNVAQTMQQSFTQIISNVITLVGVLVMMVWVSPLLALIAIIAVPLSAAAAMVIGKRSQVKFAAMWKSTGAVNAVIEEAYSGYALVKVFGRNKEVEAQFRDKNDELYDSAFGAQFLSGVMMPVMFLIGNITYVLVAVVGGLRVATGQMTLGGVQAFIQYSRMFSQPITQLASMANQLQSGVASAERVFEVLDAVEQDLDVEGDLPRPVRGRVVFDDVSFSYSPDKPLIEHLILVAEPGSSVAIVGPTGAGKTTLVNLLLRFYEVNAGCITLDDVDITSVPRSVLRGEMGMVLQDTWLFSGTIKDNIAYGRPDATDDEILAAAKAAYVDRFVHSLPDGYDTVLDEEGSSVSVGEKQLITIARAFLSEPTVLILDEATSSVDTRTELLVQRAMARLRSGRTAFVIAHRLSTIRDADVIVVMEDGAIVEQGNHSSLIAAQGRYYDLYQSQFTQALANE